MPKRIIKRKSSSRRISARPLSFWQFIRKNLLIIAGLLLLPVTVGAVVSSYNYANQSSAAGKPRKITLTTQDIICDWKTSPTECGAKCIREGKCWLGNVGTLTELGVRERDECISGGYSKVDNQCVICEQVDATHYSIKGAPDSFCGGGQPPPDSAPTASSCQYDICSPNSQPFCAFAKGKMTGQYCDKCIKTRNGCPSAVGAAGNYEWQCHEDLTKCPVENSSPPQGQDCTDGDQVINICGKASDGSESKCKVCQGGKWSATNDLDCPNKYKVAILCGFTNATAPPQQPTSAPPAGGGGELKCDCLPEPGYKCDGARIGNDGCPPDGPEGQACCKTVTTKSGLDIFKAIKSIFGL